MRILYFDINGTLTVGASDHPKRELASGRFEAAVRRAGFQQLVCVSSMVGVVEAYRQTGREVDGHKFIFQACGGTFEDLDWFRLACVLEPKYRERAAVINVSEDWWYVDDYALEYVNHGKRSELLGAGRILAPAAQGDGKDVLEWLAAIPGRPKADA